jgi:hypothetical protein
MSSEIVAALLGALAAGLLQTILSYFDRRREAEATLVAIASEVASICRLIRHQNYLGFVAQEVEAIHNGVWDGRGVIIDIRCNYFSVFEALSPNLGKIDQSFAAKIVNFYAYCKSAIDSTRPDGPMVADADAQFIAENLESIKILLETVLLLGDEIVQFPRKNIQILMGNK